MINEQKTLITTSHAFSLIAMGTVLISRSFAQTHGRHRPCISAPSRHFLHVRVYRNLSESIRTYQMQSDTLRLVQINSDKFSYPPMNIPPAPNHLLPPHLCTFAPFSRMGRSGSEAEAEGCSNTNKSLLLC